MNTKYFRDNLNPHQTRRYGLQTLVNPKRCYFTPSPHQVVLSDLPEITIVCTLITKCAIFIVPFDTIQFSSSLKHIAQEVTRCIQYNDVRIPVAM